MSIKNKNHWFNMVSLFLIPMCQKLYLCKCAHFLLFLFLSTFFIYHFLSYTKILIMIPLIPAPNSLYSYPDSPHSHDFDRDSPHFHHSPYSVLRFPIPAFTDSWKIFTFCCNNMRKRCIKIKMLVCSRFSLK